MTETPVPPTNRVHYHEVNREIQTGDLFLFRGNYRSSRLFEKLTHAFYSHAGLVAWWHDRMMILQAEPKQGIQAVPLSVAVADYPGRADWYRLKREAIPDLKAKLPHILVAAKADLGQEYGYVDLLKNIWRWVLHVKLRDPVSPKGMFCSEYVERCFQSGGLPLTEGPAIATMPKDVALSPLVQYMATIEHDPARTGPRTVDDVPPGGV